MAMAMVGLGGRCHWCAEAVFQPLVGTLAVRRGFIRSDTLLYPAGEPCG